MSVGLRVGLVLVLVCAHAQARVDTAPAPSDSSSDNSVIAKQGKAEVTGLDVDAHVAAMPLADRAGFIDSPKRIEQMLSHILLRRNLAIEAREMGIDKDPIAQREMAMAAESVLMRRRLDKVRADAVIPDLEPLAREKFLANRDAYQTPETVTVAHILLDTKKRTDAEAVAQLTAWSKDIAAGKATIEDLAKKHSDDPGVTSNNGVYADKEVNTFVPPFAEAVRKLAKTGDLSAPVKTEFGYHLIQLKSRVAPTKYKFEDISAQLIAGEREKFIKQAQSALVEKMKGLPLEASEASVEPLRWRYGTPTLVTPPKSAEATPAAAAADAQTGKTTTPVGDAKPESATH